VRCQRQQRYAEKNWSELIRQQLLPPVTLHLQLSTHKDTYTHTHVYKLDAIHCKTSIHAADNIYVQFSDKFIDYFAITDLCCCIQTHTTHCVMPVTLQHKGVQSNKAMTVISRTKLITVNGWWQKNFQSPEFGKKFQREVCLFCRYTNFLTTQTRKPLCKKTSLIRSAVSTTHWLETNGWMDSHS